MQGVGIPDLPPDIYRQGKEVEFDRVVRAARESAQREHYDRAARAAYEHAVQVAEELIRVAPSETYRDHMQAWVKALRQLQAAIPPGGGD